MSKHYQKVKCNGKVTSNYIYHMLSVSRVHYDNWYGAAYRQLHQQEDLDSLLKHKEALYGTSSDSLYSLLVTFPSSLSSLSEVKDYYEMLNHLFIYEEVAETKKRYGDIFKRHLSFDTIEPVETLEDCFVRFYHQSNEIIDVSGVLLRNVNIFLEYVWPIEEPILNQYARKLNKKIASMHMIEKWDGALNNEFFFDHFDIIISRAIIDGPEGINLSKTQDLFAVSEQPKQLLTRISHELGVFSIISSDPIKYFEDFRRYKKPIEGLASYFNNTIYPSLSNDELGEVEYMRFMEACHKCGQPVDINGWIEASIQAIEGVKNS